jgi:hypothetical protein
MTLAIKFTDGPSEPRWITRTYSDAVGRIEVVRRSPEPDSVVEALLGGYTYGGRPLVEVWPARDGAPYNTETTEMVVSALAFGRLGYEKVALRARKPPNPDVFADAEQTGSVAIEITLNMDPDETAFQDAMRAFIGVLNKVVSAAEHAFPNDVSLGFVSLPGRREYDFLARALLAQLEPDLGKVGTHEFSGELSGMFAQYMITPRGEGPPFSGGAVVNVRGHADLLATAMERIVKKRDRMDYLSEGRALWLVVGVTLPLIGPDVMGELYGRDISLGKLDRIVLSDSGNMVTFARTSAESEGIEELGSLD